MISWPTIPTSIMKTRLNYDSVMTLDERFDVEWKLCPCPQVLELFSCLTQPNMKSVLSIMVKMPTIVGILNIYEQEI